MKNIDSNDNFYILKNENLVAKISKNPFELISLQKHGKEYVYQQESTWKKSWPICFPITGKLINDQYQYNGKTYKMTGHGFFRAITNWEIIVKTDEKLTVGYTGTSEFFEQYPFNFKLKVTYQLKGNELINKVKITNLSLEEMPYNFGWHPAFICDDHLGKVIFDREQTVTHIPTGTFFGKKMLTENKTELVLDQYDFSTGQCYALLQQTTDQILIVDPFRVIKMTTSNYPNVLIWKCQDDAKYICVEPWDGQQDDLNYQNTSFEQKPWIHKLPSMATKEYVLQIELKK